MQNDADDGFDLQVLQGTSGQVLTSNGADAKPTMQNAAAGSSNKIAHLKYIVSSGTNGGGSTTSYTKRTINTEDDPDAILSVASSVINFAATGDYILDLRAIMNVLAGNSRARLRNTTLGTDAVLGLSYDLDAAQSSVDDANAYGRFNVSNITHDYEIQVISQFVQASDGWGIAISLGGAEEFLNAKFTQLA